MSQPSPPPEPANVDAGGAPMVWVLEYCSALAVPAIQRANAQANAKNRVDRICGLQEPRETARSHSDHERHGGTRCNLRLDWGPRYRLLVRRRGPFGPTCLVRFAPPSRPVRTI